MAVLSNVVEAKKVTATASDEKYNYKVDYEVADNGKTLVSVNINATIKESGVFAGSMSYTISNSNQQVSAPSTSDMTTLAAMFGAVMTEIKSTLVAE